MITRADEVPAETIERNLFGPPPGAEDAARTIALTGGIEAIDVLYGTLASITPEDIRAAANRYLQDERRTVLILKGE